MKTKSFFLALLSFCLSTPLVFSQGLLNPEWEVIESSALTNGNAEAWAIGTDQNGNIVWGVNKDAPGVFEYMDAFVYTLDENSNLIRLDTAYTGTFAQQSYNLKVTDSMFYVAGRTCRALGIDSCDALFFATDVATGSTAWDFVWDGGYGYEEIDGIALESDGIYITGWSVGNGSKMDVLLMKIDYSGNLIWQTTWGSTGGRDDHQDGHIVVDDSLIYISGLYDGSPGLGWDGYALLATFDKTNGNFVDSVKYGRQDSWFNAENALGMTTDGTYLYVTGYTTVSTNNWDLFLAKFDKNLNEIWYTTWGGTAAAETARSLVVAPDGSIYVGGTTESYGSGEMDVALVKFDPAGTLEWYKTWGGARDDQTLDVHLDGNSLYMTGKTQSFHPTQKWEALLLKVEIDSSVSINEVSNGAKTKVSIFPNPMSTSATLQFSNTKNLPHQLFLYNALGQEVRSINNITTGEVILEKKDLSSGAFFYQLLSGGQVQASGKLIIE